MSVHDKINKELDRLRIEAEEAHRLWRHTADVATKAWLLVEDVKRSLAEAKSKANAASRVSTDACVKAIGAKQALTCAELDYAILLQMDNGCER